MTLPLSPSIVRRFSVASYHRMIEVGLLDQDEPVELLEGWIVNKMPHTPPHDATIDVSGETITKALPEGWRVRTQSAITLAESEPEPDLAIVRGPARRYTNQHPGPADVAVVVEVSASSLDHDRDVKGPIYAAAGIAIYWIINLKASSVEVYSNPTASGYATRDDYALADSVALVIEGRQVALLPVRELMA